MKRLMFGFCIVWGILSFSQDRCANLPQDEESLEHFENWIKTKKENTIRKSSRVRYEQAEIYYIPVVVHVIHQGEEIGFGDNIPTERIQGQIDILNEDLRKMNKRRNSVVPSTFKSVEADIEIEFLLARQDPDGLPTNGIVRINGNKSQYSFPGHDLKAKSYWPAEDYLNIWVAETGNSIGWATFPVTSLEGVILQETNRLRDGIVVDDDFFGENPTTDGTFASHGQTLTHELGHFLGLRHIWGDGGGDGCASDDYCDDTPNSIDDHGGKSLCSFPGEDTCTNDTDADMFMNFMDYTDDDCLVMFTEDQKIRMRTIMENSPRRLSLRTSPGLEFPLGALDYDMAIQEIVDFPIATCENAINASIKVRNLGAEVITNFLIEYSINGGSTLNSLVEDISLGLGEEANVSLPLSSLPEGELILNWSINELNGVLDQNTLNNSLLASTYINTKKVDSPFREDFDSHSWAKNSIEGTPEWEELDIEGESSFYVSAYESTSKIESWLVSPQFSLASFTEVGLFFKMNYGITSGTSTDKLKVLISTSCADSFQEVWSSDLNQLEFPSLSSELGVVPKDEWVEQFIDLSGFAGEQEARLAFAFQNDGGNNFFLDDVDLTNNSDENQPRLEDGGFIAYPNPARESFKVTLNLPEAQEVLVQLIDISGSMILEETYSNILNQTLTIDTGDLYGTYFLRIRGKNINKIQRILIGR